MYAHRATFAKFKGPLIDGMDIDHLCRHPACVNPDHLEQVLHAVNIRRGKNTKLTDEQIVEIRGTSESALSLSKRLGIDRGHIYKIRKGKKWPERSFSLPTRHG